ncbi:D-arabinono-1,4-lactone oxidase [Collimonas fungivorans]|uniref:D-arabinono-1,4-lactone oxidase n=1 Tax=Collimonas fungivorans TaxID=158899 RepID=UPI0026ECE650|nr:D-arabinono-1,4-lactone oxidase [Collimonas fungivorans]
MPQERRTDWRNWSGSVQFSPARHLSPGSMEELKAVVRTTVAAGQSLRVVGSGHSFVPLVETGDALVSLRNMSGVASVEAGVADVWAGTDLKTLGEQLGASGHGMLNLGDINKQSLAGAVGTGTHGTGIGLGSISTQVRGMTLVMPDGEPVACSPTQEPDLFAAARVAMGSLGIMAKIRIEVVPAYRLELVKQTMDLDVCLDSAPVLAQQNRHFEFYWFPHTRKTVVKLMNQTEAQVSNQGLTSAMELALENGVFGMLSRLVRAKPARAPGVARLIGKLVGGKAPVMVADCRRAFATERLVRFNEMEYELPAGRGPEALRELAAYIEKNNVLVHFPVEYRYVKGDDIWLSPFYGRDSASISVHQYVGMEHEPYFRAAEAIFLNHGGRPHWGKMHNLGARQLAGLYPRWDDFMVLRNRIDPAGVFINPLLKRYFGC